MSEYVVYYWNEDMIVPNSATNVIGEKPSLSAQSNRQDRQLAAQTDNFDRLQTLLEGLQDGLIIAEQTGDVKRINAPAQHICAFFKAEENTLPAEIWSVCQAALENQDVIARQRIGIDVEVALPNGGILRVRVQEVQLEQAICLLIVLEDYQQTIRNKALSDSVLYEFTEREAEVWRLRLRGADYNEISTILWISPNTVKKHVKNILAKRRDHGNGSEHILMDKPDYTWDIHDNLALRYSYDLMAAGILNHFITAIRPLINQQVIEKERMWKNGIVFASSQATAEVTENYLRNEINVRISGHDKKPLLKTIRRELQKIHGLYEHLDYRELISCSCKKCRDSVDPEFYPYDLLLKFISDQNYSIQCRKSYQQVDIRCLISYLSAP